MSEGAVVGRPRRWWLAGLLNLFLWPAGYAYVGAWRLAAAIFALVLFAAVLAMEWTLRSPPGFYGLSLVGLYTGGIILNLGLALHAAWLARRAAAKSGPRWRHGIGYAAIGLAGLGGIQALRAFHPNPTYEISSASMNPTIEEGDIVAVRGARARCRRGPVEAGTIVVSRRQGVHYISRAVAGPGQTVSMSDGVLSVDGQRVVRRHLGAVTPEGLYGLKAAVFAERLPNGASYETLDFGPDSELDDVAPVVVPAGSWYLLGDSRDNASDSRVHGAVPVADICATVLKVVFSKDKSRVGQPL